MKKRPVKLLLLPALLLLAGLPACNNDDDNTVTPPPTGTANVMVIHASPDAPAIDLYVDGARVDSNLAYLENTGYLSIPAGVRTIMVTPAGSTVPVIQGPVPITAGMVYSVFAADSLASITPMVLFDTLTAPAVGKAKVRFVHLSPNGGPIDLTIETGAPVFSGIAFENSTGFAAVDTGTYHFQLRDAGTANVTYSLPEISLTNGKSYTIYARGFAGSTSGAQAFGAEVIQNN